MNPGVIWTGSAESDLLHIFNFEEDFSEGAGESCSLTTPVTSSRSSGGNHSMAAAGLAA